MSGGEKMCQEKLKLVLDIGVIRGIISADEKTQRPDLSSRLWHCILHDLSNAQVITCPEIMGLYENHLKKISQGYNLLRNFYFNLLKQKGKYKEYYEETECPEEIKDRPDQPYINCAYSTNADHIISHDNDFKNDFDDSNQCFTCLKVEEFLEEKCEKRGN